MWRLRKKRRTPLDGSEQHRRKAGQNKDDASDGDDDDGEGVKKLCEGKRILSWTFVGL